MRNYGYNQGIFKSLTPPIYSIGIGNITMGGTGKTPVTDFLIKKLKSDYSIGVISRGYGRKTTGYIEITMQNKTNEVGDEPLMLYKMNQIPFFVSENRILAIHNAISKYPKMDLLIFDDIFQHRKIRPHKNILLVDHNRLVFNDFHLPSGNLRESVSGISRADIVLFTKCPILSVSQKSALKAKIMNFGINESAIFFSHFEKEKPRNVYNEFLDETVPVIAVAALANNEVFFDTIENQILDKIDRKDHYHYQYADFQDYLANGTKFICTEKDFIKIQEVVSAAELAHFYYIKINLSIENEPLFLKSLI